MLEFDANEQELELFLAENNDHLQLLDQHIVQLETIGNDPQLVQSIFRSAHTIKGAAGLIGHQRMAELAHDMESVFDGLRAGTLQVTPRLVDALLAALDALRTLNEEVITRVPSPITLEGIRASLAACLRGEGAPAPAQPASTPAAPLATPAADPSPSRVAGPVTSAPEQFFEVSVAIDPEPTATEQDQLAVERIFDVDVSIDPACALSAARTLQVYLELHHVSRVLRTEPTLEQIEADDSASGLRATVALREAPDVLAQRLSRIGDVRAVQVTPCDATASAPAATALAAEFSAAAPAPAPAPDPVPALREAAPVAAVPAAQAVEEFSRAMVERKHQQEGSIRISVSIVDNLMSLVSELVLSRTRLQTLRTQLQQRYPNDDSVNNLEDAVGRLDQISNDMQATVMKARMVPVDNVFNKFPRLVRDLSAQIGKQVQFTMRGNDTELDRSVIEQLSDPLTHLLRNALDHGIEPPADRLAAGKPAAGSVLLSATPCENHILIEVRDDGRGIDGDRLKASAMKKGALSAEAAERLNEREAIELVFLPGFSTAQAVTDISGRGVGMDIVKSTIERMGGRIAIESEVGVGTTFSITLPLTLAIMQALLVTVEGTVYAIPLNLVTEILSVPISRIQMMQGTEATILRGTILPLLSLHDYFGYASTTRARNLRHVVATRIDGQVFGLEVDQFLGEQEIVMKPLGSYMGNISGLTGATILGDGRIGLLIDVAALRTWVPSTPRALSA